MVNEIKEVGAHIISEPKTSTEKAVKSGIAAGFAATFFDPEIQTLTENVGRATRNPLPPQTVSRELPDPVRAVRQSGRRRRIA